ncbi:MAG: PD-(D/E)XK nuclease family protein [Bacteroidota bacterium]|nr:PD-(D/E)XK nuclease family protein [Bacteroidota bacterium]
MKFLEQVAAHYYSAGDIERRCFIFPNRRSMLFFRKYLGEAVAASREKKPLLVPEMLTVNEFFYKVAGVDTATKVNLLLELYEVYRSLNPKAEPLDEFIFWGDVILADFNDVDKYLISPKGLFTNVADYRQIQDSFSYLTDDQREAIENFIKHFRADGKLKVNLESDDPDVKSRFLMIWNLLLPIYEKFRERLSSLGMAYEGMVYRDMAEKVKSGSVADLLSGRFLRSDSFVFVGLNALNECEKTVMKAMRNAGIAEFCWDYSSAMIRDSRNKSSFFMAKNVSDFPQAFSFEPVTAVPQVNVISVPSSIGQAKQIPELIGAPEDTAIVLPDETMLMPVLNSIPEEISDINVTMGYPMTSSEFYGLMDEITNLQLHLRQKGQRWLYYHKQVRNILSSGIFGMFMGEAGRELIRNIKAGAKLFIPQEDLSSETLGEEERQVIDTIFRPVVTDSKSTDAAQIKAIQDYQKSIIDLIGPKLKDTYLARETEFARLYRSSIVNLSAKELPVLPLTYIRMLQRLLAMVSVPYSGEPLKGLQIMGPLETRALDFGTVIILSCNEGVFPRKTVSSSFIPPELRKGFGLPTYEFQDSVWAYYFYRMIQRAGTVWLVYDSRTEGIKSGEESRYIKQLQYHFRVPVRRYVARAELKSLPEDSEVPKPADIADRLRKTLLSATAMQNYLTCPVKFYYHTIERLKAEDEVAESLDAGMLGNVYHAVMQALYLGEKAMEPDFSMERKDIDSAIADGTLQPLTMVTSEYIGRWLKRRPEIKGKIRSLILGQLHTTDVSGRNLVLEEVVCNYVMKTLEVDKRLLDERHLKGFRILGLEKQMFWTFEGYRFHGYVDRLDSLGEGSLRIVDYKTGKVEDSDVHIDKDNLGKVISALYGESEKDRPKIAFQLFIYDKFITSDKEYSSIESVENVIYPAAKLFVGDPLSAPMNSEFSKKMEERLSEMLKEIADPSIPFRRTGDSKACEYCDFKNICGR